MAEVVIKPEPDDAVIVKCCVCCGEFDLDCDDVYEITTGHPLWICDECLEQIRNDQ